MNVILFLSLLALTAGLAAAYGGRPERWIASMFVAAALASHLAYTAPTQRYYAVEAYVAAVDVALLVGITLVMVRADRFWPIALFAIHGVTVLAHAVKLLNSAIIRHAYAISIAAPAYLTLIVLIAGVFRHRRRLRCFGRDRDWSWDFAA